MFRDVFKNKDCFLRVAKKSEPRKVSLSGESTNTAVAPVLSEAVLPDVCAPPRLLVECVCVLCIFNLKVVQGGTTPVFGGQMRLQSLLLLLLPCPAAAAAAPPAAEAGLLAVS